MSAGRPGLRQRVTAAILDAAAEILSREGDQANMADVAGAAGVARATLYRYFPRREALLEALTASAVDETAQRLETARLEEVPLEEGFMRAIRALVVVGDYFVVLTRERARSTPEGFDQRVVRPLRQLIQRGQSEGAIRGDIQVSWLLESLIGVIVSVLLATPRLGVEDMVAAIAGLYLDGARPRDGEPRSD